LKKTFAALIPGDYSRQKAKECRMTDVDLNSMSLAELKQLQRDVAKAVNGYEARKKSEARSALEAKAQELGFSLSELTGAKKTRKSSGSTGPKYRHPENPEITWSGRGRQPAWFKQTLEAGKSPETMAV
jgi:DNA-binding protein H-NS